MRNLIPARMTRAQFAKHHEPSEKKLTEVKDFCNNWDTNKLVLHMNNNIFREITILESTKEVARFHNVPGTWYIMNKEALKKHGVRNGHTISY